MGFVTLNEAINTSGYPKIVMDATSNTLDIDGKTFTVGYGAALDEYAVDPAITLASENECLIYCGGEETVNEILELIHGKIFICEINGMNSKGYIQLVNNFTALGYTGEYKTYNGTNLHHLLVGIFMFRFTV